MTIASASRLDAKAQRDMDAKSAWQDYLDEQAAVLKRTAQLRELRLAEAAKAERRAKRAKKPAGAGAKRARKA